MHHGGCFKNFCCLLSFLGPPKCVHLKYSYQNWKKKYVRNFTFLTLQVLWILKESRCCNTISCICLQYQIRDYELLIKSSVVIIAVILCFFLHTFVPAIHLTVGEYHFVWPTIHLTQWVSITLSHHPSDTVGEYHSVPPSIWQCILLCPSIHVTVHKYHINCGLMRPLLKGDDGWWASYKVMVTVSVLLKSDSDFSICEAIQYHNILRISVKYGGGDKVIFLTGHISPYLYNMEEIKKTKVRYSARKASVTVLTILNPWCMHKILHALWKTD